MRAHAGHPAAPHRRARAGGRARRRAGRRRGAPQHRRRPAGRRDRPVHDRPRAAAPAGRAARLPAQLGAASGRSSCWSGSTWWTPPTGAWAPTPAACAAASTWRWRWCTSPRCCSWTSPPPGSTPSPGQTLWDEVRRLNRESGTTVFLTTQYLEEADQLAGAGRDHRRRQDRRRGHPGRAQGAGRRPDGSSWPSRDAEDHERATPPLRARSASPCPRASGHLSPAPARRGGGAAGRGPRPRRGRRRGRGAGPGACRASTTSSWPRPAAAWRPRGPRSARRRARRRREARPASRPAALARRAVIGTLRTPQALFPGLFFPLVLMAIFTGSFGDAPGHDPGLPAGARLPRLRPGRGGRCRAS